MVEWKGWEREENGQRKKTQTAAWMKESRMNEGKHIGETVYEQVCQDEGGPYREEEKGEKEMVHNEHTISLHPNLFLLWEWLSWASMSLLHNSVLKARTQDSWPQEKTPYPASTWLPKWDPFPLDELSNTLMGLPQSKEGTHAACQLTLLSPWAVVS